MREEEEEGDSQVFDVNLAVGLSSLIFPLELSKTSGGLNTNDIQLYSGSITELSYESACSLVALQS